MKSILRSTTKDEPVDSGLSAKIFIRSCVLIIVATIVTYFALILRLSYLDIRPMHGDEAIHAFKFAELLEKGVYIYNPNEYHGPTLNYLTLIPAMLSGAEKLPQITEVTLRIVPVFFGVLLVLLLLLVLDGLGRGGAVFAGILTAISPAMVFYSRYYIHEMLLVCFSFGAIACGYRYTQSRKVVWALLTGVFLGLMHATKETSIIAFGSMFLAVVLVILLRSKKDKPRNATRALKLSHLIAGLFAAVVVSVLFYSSFFSNPAGVLDSFRAYTAYFRRASGNTLHIHPWYYYLKMLLWSKYSDGPVWSEAFIVVLAVVGFIAAMMRKKLPSINVGLLRFVAFYTIILTFIYSAIPYKTPWCMLGFLHGMILLAGVGAVTMIKWIPRLLYRVIVVLLLIAGLSHLSWQAYLSNYKYYADSRNPYVYAHPTADVFIMVQRVKEISDISPDGKALHIEVICPGHDYWPLPWYLRCFNKVYWRSEVVDNVVDAPVIIASPSVEQELLKKLYQLPPPGKKNLYVPLFDTYMELRPQVELRGYVRKELWDHLRPSKPLSSEMLIKND